MNYNSVIQTVIILVSDLLGFELDHLSNNDNTVGKMQLLPSLFLNWLKIAAVFLTHYGFTYVSTTLFRINFQKLPKALKYFLRHKNQNIWFYNIKDELFRVNTFLSDEFLFIFISFPPASNLPVVLIWGSIFPGHFRNL